MTVKIKNPQAFPVPAGCWPNDEAQGNSYGEGMSLRDYLAAHCPITFTEHLEGWKQTNKASTDEAMIAYARFRYKYADAMLVARD